MIGGPFCRISTHSGPHILWPLRPDLQFLIFDFPLSFLEILTIMIINDAAFCAECLDAVFHVLPPSVHASTPSLPSVPLPLSQADKLAADPRPYRAFRRPLDAAEQVSPKLNSIPSLPSTGHATAAQESAQESLPSTRCLHTRFPHRAACMEHANYGNSGPRSTRTAP